MSACWVALLLHWAPIEVITEKAPGALWKWSPLATVDPDPPVAAAIALVQSDMVVAADGVPWEWSSLAKEYSSPLVLVTPNPVSSMTDADQQTPNFI